MQTSTFYCDANSYIVDLFRPETQPMHYRGSEAVATRSRQAERPKDSSLQPQSSERNRQLGSSHGSESRNRTRSSSERRDHGRSDRASDDYHEHHSSRKRVRDPSPPVYGDRQSSRRSRNGSRSLTREDSSDDERNFKRRWGHRSSVSGEMRRWWMMIGCGRALLISFLFMLAYRFLM